VLGGGLGTRITEDEKGVTARHLAWAIALEVGETKRGLACWRGLGAYYERDTTKQYDVGRELVTGTHRVAKLPGKTKNRLKEGMPARLGTSPESKRTDRDRKDDLGPADPDDVQKLPRKRGPIGLVSQEGSGHEANVVATRGQAFWVRLGKRKLRGTIFVRGCPSLNERKGPVYKE